MLNVDSLYVVDRPLLCERILIQITNQISYVLQAKKAKQAEIERKRAEVRKRMEEASKAKKAKKGFMTPERKKKLRVSFCYFLELVL